MRKSFTNNFIKGMNKDMDKSLQTGDSYLHSENFRINATTDSTTGSLENILGNTLIESLSGYKICGYCVLRNELILFARTLATPIDYYIYKYTITDAGYFVDKTTLYHSTQLVFSDDIKAIGRYENELVKKVYFVSKDGSSNLRFFNYADTNLSTQTVDLFELIPDTTFTNLTLESIGTGALRTGAVQYVYKLYNTNGSETLFSSPSAIYHITDSSEGLTEYKYKGSAKDVVTGKGFYIKLDNIDNMFSKFSIIEVVAIHYESLFGAPAIRIIDRINIADGIGSIRVLDYGQSKGSYSLEELTIMGTSIFTATDIETKNNYLFASNISEEYFDIDFDARVYRFTRVSNTLSKAYIHQDLTHRIVLNYDEGDKYTNAEKYVSGSWITDSTMNTTLDLIGNRALSWVVPDDYNCINYYNNTAYDVSNPVQLNNYKNYYQSNGNTLGGSGINISYKFGTEQFYESVIPSGQSYESWWNQSQFEKNSTYSSYSSPFVSARNKSFLRDETYRFYIVLVDDRGRESFPKWISDIRMPHSSNINGYQVLPGVAGIEEGVTYRVVSKGDHISSTTDVVTYNSSTYHYGEDFVGVSGQTSYTVTTDSGARVAIKAGLYKTIDFQAGLLNVSSYSFMQNNNGVNCRLFPVFKISNLPSNIKSFRITYCERSISDKSILGQGILGKTFEFFTGRFHPYNKCTLRPLNGGSPVTSNTILSYISPESIFTNNISFKDGDYLERCYISEGHFYANTKINVNTTDQTVHYFKGIEHLDYGRLKYDIEDFINISYIDNVNSTSSIVSGGTNIDFVNSPRFNNSTNSPLGIGGSKIVLSLKQNATVPSFFQGIDTGLAMSMICNYKRNVFDYQYGGPTYADRQQSKSVICSDIYQNIDQNAYVVKCYGDTFISTYDYAWSMYTSDIAQTQMLIAFHYIPVETEINLNLRLDDSFHRIFYQPLSILVKETAGRHYKGSGDATSDSNYYIQEDNLYTYNSVYSRGNSAKVYSPKPVNWQEQKNFDTMVKYSEKKINGEEIDSWTRFKSTNYIEVDSEHGPITNLLTYNNLLYFWQPNAFGTLAVNPRTLLSDNNGLELTLGTGGVLDRYDYFTTGIGNSFVNGVMQSNNGIYWLDNKSNDIYRFNGDEIPLSKVKGVRSYLNSLGSITNIIGVNDKINNDIIFTITYDVPTASTVLFNTGSGPALYIVSINNYTNHSVGDFINTNYGPAEILLIGSNSINLSYEEDTPAGADIIDIPISTQVTMGYNEFVDAFTSFYSFTPQSYISILNNYYSVYNNSGIWMHNNGDYCSFYNTVYPSSIKFIANPEFYYSKVFNNMSFYSNSMNGDINQLYDTFNSIRVYNDYQNTDYVTLTAGDYTSLVRKERGFNTQVPRNKVNQLVTGNPDIFDTNNLSSAKEYAERMRDKYIIVDLIYNNANNYKFNVPYVVTDYSISIR